MSAMSRMSRVVAAGACAFAVLASAQSAFAVSNVAVWGERFLSPINNVYNGLADTNSTILSNPLAGGDLAGVDLFWAVQPADAYTQNELNIMQDYLGNGGRIAFMGEHGGFTPLENNRINDALAFLGVDIQIVNDTLDPSDRVATVGDGQILAHPLTEGVNSYRYAAFAPLDVSGTAQSLMLSEDLNSTMMAFQNVGPGSVFLITDQNVFDSSRLTGSDNERMFENLLSGNTGTPPADPEPTPIPEPVTATLSLIALGGLGLSATRRRR